MTDYRQAALEYARQHHPEFLNDMAAIVAIPSVSTDPEATGDIQRAAAWVAARTRSAGDG